VYAELRRVLFVRGARPGIANQCEVIVLQWQAPGKICRVFLAGIPKECSYMGLRLKSRRDSGTDLFRIRIIEAPTGHLGGRSDYPDRNDSMRERRGSPPKSLSRQRLRTTTKRSLPPHGYQPALSCVSRPNPVRNRRPRRNRTRSAVKRSAVTLACAQVWARPFRPWRNRRC
jgi:hypothetical protein